MRFCKGSFVEVFRKEVPTGSWVCAEIICGNGHTYTVRYVRFRLTNEDDSAVVERVPRKAIRPCPPLVLGADNWFPGDHVEVYQNMSWKTATLVKSLGQNIFLVRLVGESQEFKAHRSHLRVRQSWQDGKWFIVGKGGCAMSMKKNYTNTIEDCFQVEKNMGIQEPHRSSRTLKRVSPICLTNLEADIISSQKTRLTETDWNYRRLKPRFAELPSPLSGKVDACILSQGKLEGKSVHASFHVATTGFSVIDVHRGESNQFNPIFPCASRSFDMDCGASSMDSCSIYENILYKDGNGNTKSLCSNDDFFGGQGYDEEGCCFRKNEELFVDDHKVELHSYHSAIKALYASGPLSWEDEMKMADLRCALHISNDEHLVAIRNLIATDIRISTC